MNKSKKLTLILGNQLFEQAHFKDFPRPIFMAEDRGLCTHFKYHKHKIIHFLASMRTYAKDLKESGEEVFYSTIDSEKSYIERLSSYIKENEILEVWSYEIEDHFFEEMISDKLAKLDVKHVIMQTPMFLCSRDECSEFFSKYKKPLMNNFYIQQRKKFGILMDKDNPTGGSWNYDQKNRKKIPKSLELTDFEPPLVHSDIVSEVKKIVAKEFDSHPGDVEDFWIPIDRESSMKNFTDFLKHRFSLFGDYQDALDSRNPFLYHSLISPAINIGFLTPLEVIKEVEKLLTKDNLNSVEGFIRQIMGWREFLRGIYHQFDSFQQEENFFNHKRKLTKHWYTGDTGIKPLDEVIKKSLKWGYAHHIERLMVVGNLMLLLEVDPKEVFKWFMEMYVDSSDWVMGPNVFGMSQFSDGGIFATKPYISGSNYIFKMGHFKKDESWSLGWDGLYWRFIERKKEFLAKNHRLNMMVSMLEKMDSEKKEKLFEEAQKLQKRLTKQ